MSNTHKLYVDGVEVIEIAAVVENDNSCGLTGILINNDKDRAGALVDGMLKKRTVTLSMNSGRKHFYIVEIAFSAYDPNETNVMLTLNQIQTGSAKVLVGTSAQHAGIVVVSVNHILFFVSLLAVECRDEIIGVCCLDGQNATGVSRNSMTGEIIIDELERFYGRKYS